MAEDEKKLVNESSTFKFPFSWAFEQNNIFFEIKSTIKLGADNFILFLIIRFSEFQTSRYFLVFVVKW